MHPFSLPSENMFSEGEERVEKGCIGSEWVNKKFMSNFNCKSLPIHLEGLLESEAVWKGIF